MFNLEKVQTQLYLELQFDNLSFRDLYDYDESNYKGDSRMFSFYDLEAEGEFLLASVTDTVFSYLNGWRAGAMAIQQDQCYTREELRRDPWLFETVMRRSSDWKKSIHSYLANIPLSLAYLWLRGDHCVPVVEEEPVEEEIAFTGLDCGVHVYNVPNKDVSFKFNPTFSYDDSSRGVARNESIPVLVSKHGQRKLFMAFCTFVVKYYSAGDSIVFYGSAPGFAIVNLAQLLNIKLICVDDYPSTYTSRFDYYSFDEFDQFDKNSISVDGIFFDHFFVNDSVSYNYDRSLEVLRKFPGVYYSIKRFVSYGSNDPRIAGSQLVPMLYASKSATEYREEGVSQAVLTIMDNLDMASAVRGYVYYVRSARYSSSKLFTCNCYDCAMSEYRLYSCSLEFAIPIEDILTLLKDVCDGVFTKSYNNDLDHLAGTGTLLNGSSLVSDSNYIWHPSSLAKLTNYDRSSSDYFFSRVIRVQESDDYTRYARRPVFAKVTLETGDDPGSTFGYALPAVCVTARGGKELYYSISGKEGKVFTYADGAHEPPCFSCGAAFTTRKVVVRDFLAIFPRRI